MPLISRSALSYSLCLLQWKSPVLWDSALQTKVSSAANLHTGNAIPRMADSTHQIYLLLDIAPSRKPSLNYED